MICSRLFRRGCALAGLATLSACATQAPTQTAFLGDAAGLERAEGTLRAQIDRRRNAEAATAGAIVLRPVRISDEARLSDGIDPAETALVTAELDRQLCYALSRRFALSQTDGPDTLAVEAVVTAIARTDPAASVASAVVSRAIPVPGSIRLPLGRGGLQVEARAQTGAGVEAAAMSWSRAAGVAFDRGSLSEIGDAHRYAEDFADDFAAWLGGPDRPRGEVPQPDPCAAYGPRLDLARRAAGIGLGLHLPGEAAAPQ